MKCLVDIIIESLYINESEEVRELEKARMRVYMKIRNWKKSGKDVTDLTNQLEDIKRQLSAAKKSARVSAKSKLSSPMEEPTAGMPSIFDFDKWDKEETHQEMIEDSINEFIKDNYRIRRGGGLKFEQADGIIKVHDPNAIVTFRPSSTKRLTNGLFKWGEVHTFDCSESGIKDLEGAPDECNIFTCLDNEELISLEGCPQKAGSIDISGCTNLKSLKGCPEVCAYLNCTNTGITTLKDGPTKCKYMNVSFANLTSLQGCPKNLENIDCSHNPGIKNLKGLPKSCTQVICFDCPDLEDKVDSDWKIKK